MQNGNNVPQGTLKGTQAFASAAKVLRDWKHRGGNPISSPVFLAEHWEAISHISTLVFRTEHCGKLVLEQAMARSIPTGDSSLIPLSPGFVLYLESHALSADWNVRSSFPLVYFTGSDCLLGDNPINLPTSRDRERERGIGTGSDQAKAGKRR